MSIAKREGSLVVAVLLLGGCSTVSHGTLQPLDVRSQPLGADVSTSIGVACVTPCTLTLKRKTGLVVTVRKPGYKPLEVTVSSVDTERPGAVARSALTTGLVGYLVDHRNGALRALKPNPIDVTLTPEPPQRR
ncbi:PEGA domain-containing protein [Sphingomonas sp. UYP23]